MSSVVPNDVTKRPKSFVHRSRIGKYFGNIGVEDRGSALFRAGSHASRVGTFVGFIPQRGTTHRLPFAERLYTRIVADELHLIALEVFEIERTPVNPSMFRRLEM